MLDMAACCIPGSYAIEKKVTITFNDNQTKEFMVYRFKRYDPNKLILKMKEEGWGPGGGWPFGKNPERLCYIFKKLPQ